MQNLNSDQLRRQLDENNAAMNTLADNNQKIVELLSLRGLKAINSSSDLAEIRALLEPKRSEEIALTAEELKAGWWWCADDSEECRLVLASKGVSEAVIFRSYLRMEGLKQIHRIGNNFYWGAASDQAN